MQRRFGSILRAVPAFTGSMAPVHKTGQRLKQWLRSGYFVDVRVTDVLIVRSPSAVSLRIPTLSRPLSSSDFW
jgi:hypothetical protein